MVIDVICKACSAGPCKLGDLARACNDNLAPASVVTVQDMVNYTAVEGLRGKK